MPPAARWLGLAGVLPFAATALNLHLGWPLFDGFALQVFVVYGAVILSFLGGIRWGAAATVGTGAPTYALAVLPSLAALTCVLLPRPGLQIAALGGAFALMGLLDGLLPATGMPPWMRRLRSQLSTAVVLLHGIAWLAVRQW
jgi:hypothetical protein